MKTLLFPLLTPLSIFWYISVCGAAVLLCQLPMTHTLGFEYAFITGLALSFASGLLAATLPARLRRRLIRQTTDNVPTAVLPTSRRQRFISHFNGYNGRILDTAFPASSDNPRYAGFLRTVALALSQTSTLIIIALGIGLLNTLFVPPCNTPEGVLFFLFLPTFSSLMACITGLCIGLLVPTSRRAIAIWVVIWVAGFFLAFIEVYTTPAVFSYGTFFGYWPGVWYDLKIEISSAFITFRTLNALVCAAILSVGRLFFDAESLRFRWTKVPFSNWVWPAVFIVSATILYFNGETLGHRTSTSGLKASLPHHFHDHQLDIYFDAGISGRSRRDIIADAQYSLHRLDNFLDITNATPITVFVFGNAAQKHRQMGARHTSIAKPWLGQTYIVASDIPHWTLRHELAHLVSAQFGGGPFGTGGHFGGLIPSPALVEGIPVSATPTHRSLSLHQSARALKDLGLLPEIDDLMGLGFFRYNAQTAYTAAGAFCLFIQQTYGGHALKKMFAGASAADATKQSIASLEHQWLAFLDTVQVPASEMAAIQYRFDRPAIVASRCIREVTRLNNLAGRCEENEQWEKALRLRRTAREISGNATDTTIDLFFTQAMHDPATALQTGMELKGQNFGKARIQTISEALADMQIHSLSASQLADAYTSILPLAATNYDARRLIIKSHLAALDNRAALTVLSYLSAIPDVQRPSPAAALYTLLTLQQSVPTDQTLRYLTSRLLFHDRQYHAAAHEMRLAINGQLNKQAPQLLMEARFTLGRCYLRLKQYDKATTQFKKIIEEVPEFHGYVALAMDWIARVKWMQANSK